MSLVTGDVAPINGRIRLLFLRVCNLLISLTLILLRRIKWQAHGRFSETLMVWIQEKINVTHNLTVIKIVLILLSVFHCCVHACLHVDIGRSYELWLSASQIANYTFYLMTF
jgi:hypothetical protein